MKERGIKDVDGKVRYELVPPESLLEVARVYTYGAVKYGDANIDKGIPVAECIAAIERHTARMKMGQDISPHWGTHEAAHIAFWCFTLISQYYRNVEVDDTRKDRKLDQEKLGWFLES